MKPGLDHGVFDNYPTPEPLAGFRTTLQRHESMDAALALVLPRHAGLSGYADGSEWAVSHFSMKKVPAARRLRRLHE